MQLVSLFIGALAFTDAAVGIQFNHAVVSEMDICIGKYHITYHSRPSGKSCQPSKRHGEREATG